MVHGGGADAGVAGVAAVDDDLGGVVGPLAEGHPQAARPGAGNTVVGEQKYLRNLYRRGSIGLIFLGMVLC